MHTCLHVDSLLFVFFLFNEKKMRTRTKQREAQRGTQDGNIFFNSGRSRATPSCPSIFGKRGGGGERQPRILLYDTEFSRAMHIRETYQLSRIYIAKVAPSLEIFSGGKKKKKLFQGADVAMGTPFDLFGIFPVWPRRRTGQKTIQNLISKQLLK